MPKKPTKKRPSSTYQDQCLPPLTSINQQPGPVFQEEMGLSDDKLAKLRQMYLE
jgi:hypothetical protein